MHDRETITASRGSSLLVLGRGCEHRIGDEFGCYDLGGFNDTRQPPLMKNRIDMHSGTAWCRLKRSQH